jgi:putative hydrolase of the HAD superfamily
MTDIKAVIFDLDNTLLDRTHTFKSFAASFLDHYFSHLDAHEQLLALIIELDQDGYKDKRELFRELLEQLPWEAKPEHQELMEYYSVHYVQNAVLFDQALDVIHHTKSKYKIGLITNGRTEIQYGKIDRLGLREHFDFIIVSEEAGVKKPDRRIFEAAWTELKLKPEQCIYVGDHPVNDIEGASLAGLSTIWVQVNQPWREDLTATPLHKINRLNELLAII